ncbi:hypothetical protein RRG08_038135 [Elysia crispata]|uniref:Uncharacterized protein n=1 Tax=Elysia crispata TaxID=231223 RepID=A0AAE0ZYG7_9GAST|nr:hypothetical protein RRG08_038135 [Elysia crispata]
MNVPLSTSVSSQETRGEDSLYKNSGPKISNLEVVYGPHCVGSPVKTSQGPDSRPRLLYARDVLGNLAPSLQSWPDNLS